MRGSIEAVETVVAPGCGQIAGTIGTMGTTALVALAAGTLLGGAVAGVGAMAVCWILM